MTSSERTSLVTSIAAVLISIFSMYFQFFWRHDKLRLDWRPSEGGWPSMNVTPAHTGANDGTIRIGISPSMVFVNAGNRPVAVAEVELILLYNEGTSSTNVWNHGRNPPLSACRDKKLGGASVPWESFMIDGKSTEAHSITIPAGEIKSLLISFKPIEELVDSTWRNDSEVTTCFYFHLIDSAGSRIDRRVSAFKFGVGGGIADERPEPEDLL